MVNLAGTFVPLVTPFTDDGATLSEVRIARLVRHFVAQGVDGFVVCSDTGEFTTMSFAERKSMLETTLRECHGTVPVLTNVSTLSTSASLDLAQHAARHGARAAVIMPPYYGDLSEGEMMEHVRCVASYSGFSLIVVDPLGALTGPSRAALAACQGVSVAASAPGREVSTTDWFWMEPLLVSPCAMFPDRDSDVFARGNRAAIAKALFESESLEVGRPRMPVQPVHLSQIDSAA
jgi:hypothetical protein